MVNSIHGSHVPAGRVYLELQKVLRMCHLLCLESSKVCRYGESTEVLCIFHSAKIFVFLFKIQLASCSLEKVNSFHGPLHSF